MQFPHPFLVIKMENYAKSFSAIVHSLPKEQHKRMARNYKSIDANESTMEHFKLTSQHKAGSTERTKLLNCSRNHEKFSNLRILREFSVQCKARNNQRANIKFHRGGKPTEIKNFQTLAKAPLTIFPNVRKTSLSNQHSCTSERT